MCDSLLSPLPFEPNDLSFTLEVHSQVRRAPAARPATPRAHAGVARQAVGAGAPLSEEMRQHWCECDLQTEVGAVPRPRVVPLKSMRSEHLSMQLLVQARGSPDPTRPRLSAATPCVAQESTAAPAPSAPSPHGLQSSQSDPMAW